ncbi:ArsR/SmtB family transcription factor [Amycolatopsis sp. lyj-23]|uniref:ArsR/SmtB family transcription factor n=1 Tax=Amycolatopsis sp. lyj-23 TaxID=2789283 RepID=UPI00397A50CE
MIIRFSPADLKLVSLARKPDPMWEIALSLHVLHKSGGSPDFGGWRGFAKEVVKADARVRDCALQLGRLCPEAEYFPDFLTPVTATHSLRHGIQAVSATPRELMSTQFSRTSGPRGRLRADLCDGDEQARRYLAGALMTYYNALIRPIATEVVACAEADWAIRRQAFQTDGLAGFFRTFPAEQLRWQPPFLHVRAPECELDLGGRGLTFVPSYFCWGQPAALVEPADRPVLVYPLVPGVRAPIPAEPKGDALAGLLGRARARLLTALDVPRSSARLAERAGLAPSSVSEHLAILRAAGLVRSERSGRSVHHALTEAGASLLGAQDPLGERPGSGLAATPR